MPSIVNSLRLLADPTRLRVLLLLQQEELSVVELQEVLGMGQSRISSHLGQLKRARLVRDRRAGKNIYYALATDHPFHAQLMEIVRASAQEITDTAHDKTALALALRKRQDKAREYFNKLAGKFGRSHCPGRTWQGVSHMLLSLIGPITVADLGAGEGTLSQLLARHVKEVVAVDNSEKMVEFGAQLAKEHGFTNLQYRLGEMEQPPIAASSVDVALFSQALHHASSPARAIAAAHGILREGGRIVILDLLAHNFEQARELYADLWLGFSEVRLHELLAEGGFAQIEVSTVARDTQPPHLQTVLATAVK